jgi:YHS domain-containing protein
MSKHAFLISAFKSFKKLQTLALSTVLFIGLATMASAEGWNGKKAVIDGYDPVAYFTQSEAIRGDKQFSHRFDGGTFHFSSAENRDLFAANPNKYAPQFGGFCAYAAAKGSKAPIDPTAWTVHNDKLYLNYSKSIQKKWSKHRDDYIAKAEKNWPNL